MKSMTAFLLAVVLSFTVVMSANAQALENTRCREYHL
jgi:hypothetical protein